LSEDDSFDDLIYLSKEDRDLTLDRIRLSFMKLINRLQKDDLQIATDSSTFNYGIDKVDGVFVSKINDIVVKDIANKLERETHSVLFRIGYLGRSNKFRKIDKVIKRVILREDMWDWHCAVFNHFGNGKYFEMFNEFYNSDNGQISIDKENKTTQLMFVHREKVVNQFRDIFRNRGILVNDFVQILFVGYLRNFQYRDEFPKLEELLDSSYNFQQNLSLDTAIIIGMDKIYIIEKNIKDLFINIFGELVSVTEGENLFIGKERLTEEGDDITVYTETDNFGAKFFNMCQL
ncbi:MAG: hypothetical protein AAFQ92_21675, partial [Bacteroidota bacterium]